MELSPRTPELTPELDDLIPWDKSWLIRMGVLDLLLDYDDTPNFLQGHSATLNNDLQALARATNQWREGSVIDVGESGTLYRFLQFAAWRMGEDRHFTTSGTLKDRAVTTDPTIMHLPLAELLKLDGGTSQWASAAVLLGNIEPAPQPTPYKLDLTYAARKHWSEARAVGVCWEARKDITINRQAEAYIKWRQSGEIEFEPQQAEDYCFARAFGLITPRQGEIRWPSLRLHESDRIAAMEEALNQQVVSSADHRVVQAIAMLKGHSVDYLHPEAVNKSWPGFWQLIEPNY